MTKAKTFEPLSGWATFIKPFYRRLGASLVLLAPPEAAAFCKALGKAAQNISDAEIETFLTAKEWRGRLTVAWLIGIGKREQYVPWIGELLLASELGYAGAGYCLALALIGGADSETHLRNYLDRYLPVNGRTYDQVWAIGALAHLTGQAPESYLDGALWQDSRMDPIEGVETVASLIAFLRAHGVAQG